jgi:hypothetical protein
MYFFFGRVTSPLDVMPHNPITYIYINKSDWPFKWSTEYRDRRFHRYISNFLSRKAMLFIITSAKPRIVHIYALFEDDSVS